VQSVFDYKKDSDAGEFARQLGAVTSLMLQVKNYRYYPMACLLAWIIPPIQLSQIKVFYADNGMPIGYITWAWLAPDVEARWIADPRAMLHISEWNEAESLWIMDFVAVPGMGRMLLRHIREAFLPDQSAAKSLRRRPDGSTRHVTRWKRKCG
jgi:cytolysin-activating lysine-acyltransferase